MNIKDIATYIITNPSLTDSDMQSLSTAIRERYKINRFNTQSIAKATLREGMSVRISGISPKYWTGTEAVITGFNKTRSRANIRITKSSDYRVVVGDTKSGFPLSTLTIIGDTTPFTSEDTNALLKFLSE